MSKQQESEIKTLLAKSGVEIDSDNDVILYSTNAEVVQLWVNVPWSEIACVVSAFVGGFWGFFSSREVTIVFPDGLSIKARAFSYKKIEKMIDKYSEYTIRFIQK